MEYLLTGVGAFMAGARAFQIHPNPMCFWAFLFAPNVTRSYERGSWHCYERSDRTLRTGLLALLPRNKKLRAFSRTGDADHVDRHGLRRNAPSVHTAPHLCLLAQRGLSGLLGDALHHVKHQTCPRSVPTEASCSAKPRSLRSNRPVLTGPANSCPFSPMDR